MTALVEVTMRVEHTCRPPARCRKAWGEFLDMLVARAEAEERKEPVAARPE